MFRDYLKCLGASKGYKKCVNNKRSNRKGLYIIQQRGGGGFVVAPGNYIRHATSIDGAYRFTYKGAKKHIGFRSRGYLRMIKL